MQVMSRDCEICIVTVANPNDLDGIQLFKSLLMRQDNNDPNSKQRRCTINYKFKELVFGSNTSALEVASFVGNSVKHSSNCIMLYNSNRKSSKLLFNFAVVSSIPIVSTVRAQVRLRLFTKRNIDLSERLLHGQFFRFSVACFIVFSLLSFCLSICLCCPSG